MENMPNTNQLYQDLIHTLQTLDVKELTAEKLRDYVSALAPFSDHVKKAAIDFVLRTCTKRPLPGDFGAVAMRVAGVDHSSLIRKGTVQFNKLLALGSDSRSVLCDDWRVVYAVNTGFGSLKMFFNSCDETSWMQKRFAEAYASVDFYLEYMVPKEYLLDNGIPVPCDGLRPLVFLGDYQTCSRLFDYLGNKHEFMLPLSAEQQLQVIALANKANAVESLSDEERAANIAKLGSVIATLTGQGQKVEERTA